MYQAPHAGGQAGARQLGRQLDMGALEGGLIAVQDGHQIDDGIVAGQQAAQRGLVVHVGLEHGQARQVLHGAGVGGAARGHRHGPVQPCEFFADVAADETRAAQQQHVLHGRASAGSTLGQARGPDGAQPGLERLRLAGEEGGVVGGVGQHLLHVVARLGEGHVLGPDGGVERLLRRLVTPGAHACGAGVVGGGGQRHGAVEGVEHQLEVAGADGDVGVAVVDVRGLEAAQCRCLRAVQRAVSGMTCIRPAAPTLDCASMMKRLSWRIRP